MAQRRWPAHSRGQGGLSRDAPNEKKCRPFADINDLNVPNINSVSTHDEKSADEVCSSWMRSGLVHDVNWSLSVPSIDND